MKKATNSLIKAVLGLSIISGLASAFAGANPTLPFYGGNGAITATPHFPVVGESAQIAVLVGNSGDTDAYNVDVKISFNDWGVTFQGWQEIATVTIPLIPAGGTATAEVNYVFETRTHTCLEALIVGATENTNPDDDRGQINLEVINAGETFTYNVPVVNNGDEALHLWLVGGCKGGRPQGGIDGTVQGPCHDDAREVVVQPGEELLVPIEIDLRGFAVGQEIIFQLDAFNLGAGPGSALPQNHNHIELRIVRETARHLKKVALQKLNGVAGNILDKGTKKQAQEAARRLEQALAPTLWVDDNKLRRNGGASVFAHEQAALNQIMNLLDSGLDKPAKIALDEIARKLTDANRILAHAAGGSLQIGDDERAAGDYQGAVNAYKHAWLAGVR